MLEKEFQTLLGPNVEYKTVNMESDTVSYFESHPESDKTLVLLHGFGATGLNFINLMKQMAHINMIAVDLPARGESTYKNELEAYNPQHMADWLKRFIDAIGLQDFHMAAHSMSAHYMFEYAVRYPLLSCISLDGGYISTAHMEEYSLEQELESACQYIDSLKYDNEEAYLEDSLQQGNSKEQAVIDKRGFKEVDGMFKFAMPLEVAMNYLKGSAQYPDYQLFKEINQSILLLRADLPVEANELREQGIEELLKHKEIEVKVIENSSHTIYESQLEQTARLIEAWLERY